MKAHPVPARSTCISMLGQLYSTSASASAPGLNIPIIALSQSTPFLIVYHLKIASHLNPAFSKHFLLPQFFAVTSAFNLRKEEMWLALVSRHAPAHGKAILGYVLPYLISIPQVRQLQSTNAGTTILMIPFPQCSSLSQYPTSAQRA